MTDHCPGCPFKGCPGCRYQGDPVAAQANPGDATCDKAHLTCENGGGNDERPTAPTVDRSKPLLDRKVRKEGVASMVATPETTRITTAQTVGAR